MTKKNNQWLMFLSAVGLMTFTACADDKYDLGDLDTTIGVGSDEGFTLPTSSTKEIFLDDLLDLGNSNSVIIKENGDYVFQQKGEAVAPIHPMIDRVTISDNGSFDIPVAIEIPNLPSIDLSPFIGTIIPGTGSSIHEKIYTLKYHGTKPNEINSLKSVDTDGDFNVNIIFSENLSKFIPNFKTLKVEFPSYMEIETPDNPSYKESTNIVNASGVSTATPLVVSVKIKKLNFEAEMAEDDKLEVDGDQIIMEGSVKVAIAWDDIVVGSDNLNNLRLNSAMQIENLAITGATGSFSPKIELNNLGNAAIGNLPDFLTNENVKVDLYNPQIVVSIESDLSVPGFLNGTLTAQKEDGTAISSVNISNMGINAVEDNGGISHIMICRRAENIPDTITEVKVVDELKDIILALPYASTISFSAEAGVNPSREDSKIELGKEYTILPSYNIEAPIAFGRDARIVYTDTLDGWNDGIQDYEFADKAYVRITADIENRIPAHLTMNAHAIDINGNQIDNLIVNIDSNIKASKDGNTSETSPISITIEQKAPNALKAVDGIIFTIEAAASDESEEGITLNAKKHSLLAKNIKVTLMGKVVIKSED